MAVRKKRSDDDLFKIDEKGIAPTGGSKYEQIIRSVFFANWQDGSTEFIFSREQIDGSSLGINPKNIGDIIYTYRYSRALPDDILAKAPEGHTWIIEGAGTALYRFRAVKESWFVPSDAEPIILPDRTPHDIIENVKDKDEQAILSIVNYNRLLDLFLRARLERKQSHWRQNVTGIGQIEIDDVYIGHSEDGTKVVIPVQAKRDKDKISSVQIMQDVLACAAKNDGKVCRPVAVHWENSTEILTFMEFGYDEALRTVELIRERRYLLKQPYSIVVDETI
jgi:hypothetical protein